MNHKKSTRFLKAFLLGENCFKPITLGLDLDKNKPKTLIWAVAYSDHSRLVGHLTRSCGQLGTSGQKVFILFLRLFCSPIDLHLHLVTR